MSGDKDVGDYLFGGFMLALVGLLIVCVVVLFGLIGAVLMGDTNGDGEVVVRAVHFVVGAGGIVLTVGGLIALGFLAFEVAPVVKTRLEAWGDYLGGEKR